MSRNLHHSNLLVGSADRAESYLRSFCSSQEIKIANNPDLVVFRVNTFGIDEARELKSLSTRKAISGKKYFFIFPTSVTLEAQNALLKTFEDPSSNTFFFLAVREESLIVPTLRSRMEVIRLVNTRSHLVQAVQGETLYSEAEKFLSLSVKDRLVFAKKFVDDEKNLPVFLNDLLLLSRNRKVYDIILSAHNTFVAPRLVLEHLSVVL